MVCRWSLWLRGLVPVLLLFLCCSWCFGRLTYLDGQGYLQVPAPCFWCCWFLVVVVAGLSFGLSALALSLYVAFAMVTSFWVLLPLLDLLDGAVFLLSIWVMELPLLRFGGGVVPPLS